MLRKTIEVERWQLLVVFLAVVAAAVGGLIAVGHVQAKLCNRVGILGTAQRAALDRALKTLPTLAYYRDHPDELQVALDAIRIQRSDLKGSAC